MSKSFKKFDSTNKKILKNVNGTVKQNWLSWILKWNRCNTLKGKFSPPRPSSSTKFYNHRTNVTSTLSRIARWSLVFIKKSVTVVALYECSMVVKMIHRILKLLSVNEWFVFQILRHYWRTDDVDQLREGHTQVTNHSNVQLWTGKMEPWTQATKTSRCWNEHLQALSESYFARRHASVRIGVVWVIY